MKKSDNEKMVQGKKVVNMTQGLHRQGYLHPAFVVEAEVDVMVSSKFYSFWHGRLYRYLHSLLNFVHSCGR